MAEIIRKKSLIFLILILLLASFLRLWKIDKVPVSLFGDELDAGYQAYSILKTGRDYQGNFLPINFQSLAEFRTPLYVYSAVPTVALFGITPLGVRLPAAIYGILGILAFYFLVKEITRNEVLSLLSAFVLTISSWHIQYSRAGAFEVTMLLLFLMLGIYFFLIGIREGKRLWISMFFLALTPLIYSTAKLFTPLFLLSLLIIWRDKIFNISKKQLLTAGAVLILVSVPVFYATFIAGGSFRFNYISVFSDPTTETEVGVARLRDAHMRGETGTGLNPKLLDRVIHNKYTLWGKTIVDNYFQAFSTEFLFIKGDLNLRHSIGIGEFFKVESLALILGLVFFFTSKFDHRVKKTIIFWILLAPISSAITRDGGNHATRLILMLPPFIFLISYGIANGLPRLIPKLSKLVVIIYFGILAVEFLLYQHQYWIHNPWDSERWWHAGYKDAIQSIKAIDKSYDKVIITTEGEPPWIFFAAYYAYPPDKWQKDFPLKHKINLPSFGDISYIDKFYFGTLSKDVGIYGLARVIDKKTLYLASAKEIGANLILEPNRTPSDLTLVKAIPYPSGEPAFYLFAKK